MEAAGGRLVLRKLLLEVGWIIRQQKPGPAVLYNQLNKGQKTRGRQATVALGRRLLTWCWSIPRDETTRDGGPWGRPGRRWLPCREYASRAAPTRPRRKPDLKRVPQFAHLLQALLAFQNSEQLMRQTVRLQGPEVGL